MSLSSDLGYEYADPNWMQRQVHAFFSTRFGAWLGKWLVPAVDKAVLKITGGDSTVSHLFAALPVIWVTATGAKSGLARKFPVYGIPIGDDLALIGSNFGQDHHPPWVYNLEANPNVSVEHRGSARHAVARRATEDEESRVWEAASNLYHGYSKYRQRVSNRTIKLFILESE